MGVWMVNGCAQSKVKKASFFLKETDLAQGSTSQLKNIRGLPLVTPFALTEIQIPFSKARKNGIRCTPYHSLCRIGLREPLLGEAKASHPWCMGFFSCSSLCVRENYSRLSTLHPRRRCLHRRRPPRVAAQGATSTATHRIKVCQPWHRVFSLLTLLRARGCLNDTGHRLSKSSHRKPKRCRYLH